MTTTSDHIAKVRDHETGDEAVVRLPKGCVAFADGSVFDRSGPLRFWIIGDHVWAGARFREIELQRIRDFGDVLDALCAAP